MREVILILGPSGSGKSYFQKKLVDKGYSIIISSTTREKRDGEIDGVHYNFKKDKEDFFKDEYLEHAQVGDKYYGTPKKEFYKSEKIAHVIEPYGARDLVDAFKNDKDIKIKIIFFDIDRKTCEKNLKGDKDSLSQKDMERLDRDLKDSINKRLKEKDLVPDIIIKKLDYDVDDILSKLNK
jgi:guanylate kinase